MNLADRPSLVAQYFEDLLKEHRVQLGLEDVFYGDQNRLPRTPAACVESAPFDRTLGGVGAKGRTDNVIRIVTILYVGKIQDTQINRKQCEELGEAVMDVYHLDVTADGLVTHGFVTSIAPGYSSREDGMLHACRVDWQGQSKTPIV